MSDKVLDLPTQEWLFRSGRVYVPIGQPEECPPDPSIHRCWTAPRLGRDSR